MWIVRVLMELVFLPGFLVKYQHHLPVRVHPLPCKEVSIFGSHDVISLAACVNLSEVTCKEL